MKATGIVRRIDDLGRVVIPKEIRRTLHIREGEPLEIFLEDGMVCFKKYSTGLSEELVAIANSMREDCKSELASELFAFIEKYKADEKERENFY